MSKNVFAFVVFKEYYKYMLLLMCDKYYGKFVVIYCLMIRIYIHVLLHKARKMCLSSGQKVNRSYISQI